MDTRRNEAIRTAGTLLLGCGALSALVVVGVLSLLIRLIAK